ncbi:hypothetical protein [Phormidium sp. CCY1219]|uniref:hypothetical protein n=1 Tax=Phormidium sp. CCY1219 TaxID=2886104 RepID=UPI002D1EEF0B|nr:hypothetical protein [Phormidium sp. CCY1219]MEB3828070.1 hypothetical protein [Phormidium sp. CCY1219]
MSYSGEEIYRQNSNDEEQIYKMQQEIKRRERLIAQRKHEPIFDDGEIVSFADWESRRQ